MKTYCRHPFKKYAQVRVINPCGPDHKGAKDLNFVNMPYGEPVYAMESGHVAEIRRNLPHSSNPADLPNNVVIRGSDQFYTEYAHITPVSKAPNHARPGSVLYWMGYNRPLTIGSVIREGDLIGYVDNSGRTVGDPHVHINRYTPGEAASLHDRPSPCDWTIRGVDAVAIPLHCLPALQHGIIPHRMNYYQWIIDNELRRRFGVY
ncbi:M23 family metallopeptidase [Bacillus sp. ISL-7]|uniref:M23 family metallopeptidase n=1 Tax=Bacillus sp. ISL-7 TaxID=2819136 RepID=UPI001BEBF696|nr:M23 family metallopeptidase [Bacillus sp. ISL-7]MBT2738119.1 M23 family metallopeptidase [Bacillus sp. ISL-7]